MHVHTYNKYNHIKTHKINTLCGVKSQRKQLWSCYGKHLVPSELKPSFRHCQEQLVS